MTDRAAFSATYSDWRLIKGRKVVQIVFELPLEQANEAYTTLGGMPNPAAEVWCGIARLRTGDAPDEGEGAGPSTLAVDQLSTPSVRGRPSLAQHVGMMCNDPLFQKYLNEYAMSGGAPCIDKDDAARIVRTICGVSSRSSILPATAAGRLWSELESAFICWRDADKYIERETAA